MEQTQKLPQVIKEVGFDFHWSNEKVWNLDIPIEEMVMSELEWHFDVPFWNKPGGYYDLTPMEVLTVSDEYKEEFEKIMNSDLSYPLDIMFWKGRWLMVDGLHRLVKAKKIGMKTVKVRKLSQQHIPLIRK